MRTKRPTITATLVTGLLAFSTAGVSAQGEETPSQPPAEFSGSWCIGPPIAPDRTGNETTLDIGDEGMTLTRNLGGAWRNSIEVSDSRLQGDAYQTWEGDGYTLPGGEAGVEVSASTLSIVNEDGAWVSTGYGGTYPDGTDMGHGPTVLIGEGGYQGLVAFMSMAEGYGDCSDVQGVIVDRPPVPEPYLPE